VKLGAIASRDPVREANAITESTTRLNADPELLLLYGMLLVVLDALRVDTY